MEIDYCEDQMKSPITDIAMVTHLLQEKERDLDLAARIGQTLLIRNKSVTHQNELLEDKLSQALEEASQLRHEISLKDDLLHIYADNETDSSGAPSPGREVKIFGRSQLQSQVESLHEKIKRLEQDNADLLDEQSSIQSEELHVEEQAQVASTIKQLHILQKELEIANSQIQAVTDELSKRSEEASKQQKEISSLITQIVSLQHKHKDLALEHEELQEHLSFANRSQFELSKEVQHLEDRYQEVLSVIEETREHNSMQTSSFDSRSLECTQDSQVPFQHSLAAELENSGIEFNLLPPSASSSAHEDQDEEPLSQSSPVDPSNSNLLLGKPGQPGTQDLNTAIVKLSTKKSSPSLKTIQTSSIVQRYNSKIATKSAGMRKISTAPKLRIVKPLEGSATLHHWKNLAERCMGFLPTKDEMVSSAGILIRGACIQQEAKKRTDTKTDQPKKCRFVIGDQEEQIEEPIFIGSEDAFDSFCPTTSSSLPKTSYMNHTSYKFGSRKINSPTIIKPKAVARPKFSDNLPSSWNLEKQVLLKGSQSSPDFKVIPSSTSKDARKNNNGEFDQLHGSHKLLAQQNRPTSLRCNFFQQDAQNKNKKGHARQMSTPRR